MKFFTHSCQPFRACCSSFVGRTLTDKDGTLICITDNFTPCKYVKGQTGVDDRGRMYHHCTTGRGRCYSEGLMINGQYCVFDEDGCSFWVEIPDVTFKPEYKIKD